MAGGEPQGSRKQLIALIVALAILGAGGAGLYIYTHDGNGGGNDPGDGSNNNSTTLKKAPDFTLKDTDGYNFTLSANKGSVVVLDFSATSCAPCKEQASELVKVEGAYASKGVKILSIDVNSIDTVPVLAQFKADRGAAWPFAIDTKGVSLLPEYSATSIPMIVIVDKTGHIAHRGVGLEYASELSARIDPLV